MIENILIGILIADAVLFIITACLACSSDFLLWCAKKEDPEWGKIYDEHLSDFLRMKHNGGSPEWGDN